MGIGGTFMKAAGVRVLEDISSLSTVGLVEAIGYLPRLLNTLKCVKNHLKEQKPDHVIVIEILF